MSNETTHPAPMVREAGRMFPRFTELRSSGWSGAEQQFEKETK